MSHLVTVGKILSTSDFSKLRHQKKIRFSFGTEFIIIHEIEPGGILITFSLNHVVDSAFFVDGNGIRTLDYRPRGRGWGAKEPGITFQDPFL